jgi:HD-GYP domain-containing protein (c-di-GMP phosphodiesterase class II)
MLRKIPVSEVRLGMRLHKLEGPWLRHPFWRTRFVLTDPADLQRLRDSGVLACWVDDVPGPAAEPAPAAPAPGGLRARAAAGIVLPETESGPVDTTDATDPSDPPAPPATGAAHGSPLEGELARAAAICRQGRRQVISLFHEARMGRALDVEGCLPLVEEITGSVLRHPGALVSLARLKTQDDYTYLHSMAVCALMVALGRQLGLSDAECRSAGLAGLMHDVGKALMPLPVLNKPGRLTDEEYRLMRTHPERGHELLLAGGAAGEQTLDVVLHHHERIDGHGYPHGLQGESISLFARMGAVCDVYDAITSNRPYKAGWDPAESLSRMAAWTGHFDAVVFAAFVRSLGIYPTGSVVRLASGRLAVVVDQNAGALMAPVVKVFHDARADRPLPPHELDLSRPGCEDRITGRERVAPGRFPHLDALWLDPALLAQARAD